MDKISEEKLHQRTCTNGKYAYEKMFNIICPEEIVS